MSPFVLLIFGGGIITFGSLINNCSYCRRERDTEMSQAAPPPPPTHTWPTHPCLPSFHLSLHPPTPLRNKPGIMSKQFNCMSGGNELLLIFIHLCVKVLICVTHLWMLIKKCEGFTDLKSLVLCFDQHKWYLFIFIAYCHSFPPLIASITKQH